MLLVHCIAKAALERNLFLKDGIKEGSPPGKYFFQYLNQIFNLDCRPYLNEKAPQEHSVLNIKNTQVVTSCELFHLLEKNVKCNSLKWHYIVIPCIYDQYRLRRPAKFRKHFCGYLQSVRKGPPWLAPRGKFSNFKAPDPQKMSFFHFPMTQYNIMTLCLKRRKYSPSRFCF